jgi:hypothetical protein
MALEADIVYAERARFSAGELREPLIGAVDDAQP